MLTHLDRMVTHIGTDNIIQSFLPSKVRFSLVALHFDFESLKCSRRLYRFAEMFLDGCLRRTHPTGERVRHSHDKGTTPSNRNNTCPTANIADVLSIADTYLKLQDSMVASSDAKPAGRPLRELISDDAVAGHQA